MIVSAPVGHLSVMYFLRSHLLVVLPLNKTNLENHGEVGRWKSYVYSICTVKPPNKGHTLGTGHFVPCREVVLFSEVFYWKVLKDK